jgi:hypothetical protein
MMAFDVKQVEDFAANLNARLDRCTNGEGNQCETIDVVLNCYAECCCRFAEEVRRWARDIFAGRVAFDPISEELWKAELVRLYDRAYKVWSLGRQAKIPCYVLDGQCKLESALFNLGELISGWVTPRLAVGPSARQAFPSNPGAAEEVRRRIASLPPLPADWRPDFAQQQVQFRRRHMPQH